jgi:V/A-type H+-transporting ATPase subunit A
MIVAETPEEVVQNATGYCLRGDGARLLSEVIRVRGHVADLQVFEETRGLRVGDEVEFQEQMLSATLGPGLLGNVYDGLQNPLYDLAEETGFFLTAGVYLDGLPGDTKWKFTPTVSQGDTVRAADTLGTVPEGIFDHQIMTPFDLQDTWTVSEITGEGEYTVNDQIAVLQDGDGNERPVTMAQDWPVKRPLNVSKRRLMPTEPLVTRVRIIDTMFPIVRGGTYCIPGPFGAGKTVLQHITAKHAEIDIVIVAACGERAGEVVELLRTFPELEDPRTGRSLMERTIIICNTSAMPVSAREASVYTAVTMAEYYRQMGLHVLMLADSTSRWAQALREISGRLEEIPGEEAYPAYLESRIAAFYERAGAIELHDGRIGSVTIGGSVSPAGGNFEEPVTQGTLKVVGAFEGLSKDRADARRYPAVDPLESWSRYNGFIAPQKVQRIRSLLRRGNEVRQMMTVVGEEGITVDEYTEMQKADFFDNVYLQQNAFDEVDAATRRERQQFVFDKILEVVNLQYDFDDKDHARNTFVDVQDLFRNLNYAPVDIVRLRERVAEREEAQETGRADDQEAKGDAGEADEHAEERDRIETEDRDPEEFWRILEKIDRFIETAGGTAESGNEAPKDEEPEPAGAENEE